MYALRRKVLNTCMGLVLVLVLYKLTSRTASVPRGLVPNILVSPQSKHDPYGKQVQNISPDPPPLGQQNGPYFHYPVSSFIPLPTGSVVTIPQIQHEFEEEDIHARTIREGRLGAVKEAFVHSWKGYKEHAWLHDEVTPVSGGYRTTLGGWAASLVDSLDTLWIMGLIPEFEEAVVAASKIDFNSTEHLPINVFETTIRYLGGFLGAYDVSSGKYPILLQKATEVGEVSRHADKCKMTYHIRQVC